MDDLDNKISKALKIQTPVSQGSTSSRAAIRAQEQAKRKAAAQQRLLFMLLGGAIVINVVLGYFLYGVMVQKASQDNLKDLINTELDARIKTVQIFLNSQQENLNMVAKNPLLTQALANKNREQIPVLSESLLQQFNQPLALNIFIAGEAEVDPEGAVPVRFAELDLIRRAEKRASSFPEAALIGEQWQLHFVSASAVDAAQPVLGTLLLSIDSKELTKEFSKADVSLGENILQQKFVNSAAQNIIKVGAPSSNGGQEKAIPNSNWQIKFTPSDVGLEKAEEAPTLWILVIGCTTALSLFLTLVLSRFLVKSEKEAEQKLGPTIAEVNKAKKAPVTEDALASTLFQTQDILDIAVIDEDENILGLNDTSKKKQAVVRNAASDEKVPENIFRSYDIRGIVGKELNAALAEKIGQAVGSEALDQGEHALIVARDGRTHSQELTNALIKGIMRSGCDVINVGVVPTPVMYFATYHFDDVRSGVMVTASHNPAEYNGFKVVINNNALADEAIMNLRERILSQQVHQGVGEESFREIIPHYIERIFSDVALAGDVSIVIDAGNAVPGIVAPQLLFGWHLSKP